MTRLVVIHHKPGSQAGYKVLKRYAELISSELGIDVITIQLDELPREVFSLKYSDLFLALLISRGRHYDYVKEFLESRGLKLIGNIPLRVTTRSIEKGSGLLKCKRSLIIYHSIKRSEVNRISLSLKGPFSFASLDSLNPELLNINDCAISLTVLPSRLIDNGLKGFKGRRLRYLLPLMMDDLIPWLKKLVP
jgi:hypothetical protein